MSNYAVVSLPSGVDLPSTVTELGNNPLVSYAEAEVIQPYLAVPNDPLHELQWGLNNTGQAPLGGTPDADIDALEAWDLFTGTDEAIVVIFDSGVDYDHPDLVDNLWINTQEIAGDGEDNDNNGVIDDIYGFNAQTGLGDPIDPIGHGTHVSGIVGATGNNDIGGTGVNWDIRMMEIAFGAAGVSSTAFLVATDYVLQMVSRGENIVAANASFGGPTFVQASKDAIERLNDAGIVFVAAAGNDATNNDIVAQFPAGYNLPGIITVGATDKHDQQAVFSNFGKTSVDLHAPGVEIVSTVPTYLPQAFGYPVGYDAFDGTSMATPMVTGAAAMLKGLDSTLTPVEVKNILMATVDKLPQLIDESVTSGRLNLRRAIEQLPAGAIHGTVWQDDNGDGVRQFDEPGLGGFTVYTDLNDNGMLDAGEPNVRSRPNGTYRLPHYRGPGTFIVRQESEPGFAPTFPVGGAHTVVFGDFGQEVFGIDFGNRQVTGTVSGRKFIDANGDGVFDPGELPGVGFYIYLDLNENGIPEFTEPAAVTDEDGRYSLTLPGSGNYVLRESVPPGWTQTLPGNGEPYTFFADIAESFTDLNFGNTGTLRDFGSAPAPFPNDVGHAILPGFQLGGTLVGEAVAGSDNTDNDGIEFVGDLVGGAERHDSRRHPPGRQHPRLSPRVGRLEPRRHVRRLRANRRALSQCRRRSRNQLLRAGRRFDRPHTVPLPLRL